MRYEEETTGVREGKRRRRKRVAHKRSCFYDIHFNPNKALSTFRGNQKEEVEMPIHPLLVYIKFQHRK